jgi:uncharacterized membrane protein
MTVELLTATQRFALIGVSAAFGLLAVGLRLRRARANWTVGAVAIAAGAAALVVGEQIASLIVWLSAPSAVDYNDYRWVLLSPWGKIGLAAGAAVAVVVTGLSWLATARIASPWRRAGVIGLRAAAATTALIVFIEPAVELRQVAREPNRIAVLIDDSLSMSLRDRARGPTRLEQARAIVGASAATFDSWRREHLIDFYTFSDALTPSSVDALARVEPAGRGTLIRQALEQVRARYDTGDLAGIVLLSDGVATGELAAGGRDGLTRDFLRSLDARVHTVWTGQPGLKDVSVAKVMADEFAFARTVVKVEAVIRSTGYGERRVPVTLSRDGEALRRKWVTVGGKRVEATVSFEFTPAKIGRYVYAISTPVADEEAVAQNNARAFVVRVIRDKIRVLQVAGRPSWDVRALRGMLKQNPNVDLISFFILRTEDDMPMASNAELSLIPFPTRELFLEELPSFDVIVLQNFNFRPYGITPYLENVRSYVEGGGGLVMLGGDLSFASGRYTSTPVAEALPVELPNAMAPPEALLDTGKFSPQLTELGQIHPLTALRYETADNLARWAALPALEGVNIVLGAKDKASVLAVHPRLKTRSGERMPVVVAGEYGDGRSLAVTTDSLWKWGFVAAGRRGDEGRSYSRFWENAIRWLTHDPDLRYLHVDSDRVEYEPGNSVRLDLRLLDRDYTPHARGKISLAVRSGPDPSKTREVAKATVETSADGEAHHELAGLAPGISRDTAKATVGGRDVEATDIFLVREATAELDRPAATGELLADLAEQTGGRAMAKVEEIPVDLQLAEPRIVRVDRREDVELWSGPWLLALALVFLGLEWGLRRRSGYL